ncbi:MAG: hypothetical protein WCT33_04185 [Patescibacteria group bacterium]
MKRAVFLLFAVVLSGILGTTVGCERETVPSESSLPIYTPNAGTLDEAIAELQTAETDEEATAILDRYPQAVRDEIFAQCEEASERASVEPETWTGPAVDAVMATFGKSRNEIIAVQKMMMLQNGAPVDSVEAVITDKEEWYYFSLVDETLRTELSADKVITEIDVYGSSIYLWHNESLCWNDEYTVVFWLPVCFYELIVGQFNGIIDAWAPNPNCLLCNGGPCALFLCGSAWDGPGFLEWYNFHNCADPRASTKVGKNVQKRWLFSWRNCLRSDADIARSVRARIRY